MQQIITTAEGQSATVEQSTRAEQIDAPPPAARHEIAQAEKALDELEVRPIETFEHPALLERALSQSRERLVILSPWTPKVVNGKFLASLEERLKAGVNVYIGWGMAQGTRMTDADKEPLEALERLWRQYPNFSLVWLGNTHATILISDPRVAVATSFNWLSFMGDPRRTFRDERGLLVKDSRVVDAQFDAVLPLFDPPAALPRPG